MKKKLNVALNKNPEEIGDDEGDKPKPPPEAPAPEQARAEPSSRAERSEHGRQRKTPLEFKTLLPKQGGVAGMSGKHDRGKKFFSIVYPCAWALLFTIGYSN